MTEKRRAPTEVLERLAEADVKLTDAVDGKEGVPRALYERLFLERGAALSAYRAAVAPLRTRADVDAEIVATVRARDGWHNSARLCELISEPIQDSGPSSADTEEVPSPRPPVSPAGADYSGPKPYGMTNYAPVYSPEAASRGTLEAIAVALDGTWYEGLNCDHSVTRALMNYRAECSGPAGVAAAKESKDNAAAPDGATNDRECNCDQALHLERRIGDAVRAIRRSSTIPAGLLHELLGILEGEA